MKEDCNAEESINALHGAQSSSIEAPQAGSLETAKKLAALRQCKRSLMPQRGKGKVQRRIPSLLWPSFTSQRREIDYHRSAKLQYGDALIGLHPYRDCRGLQRQWPCRNICRHRRGNPSPCGALHGTWPHKQLPQDARSGATPPRYGPLRQSYNTDPTERLSVWDCSDSTDTFFFESEQLYTGLPGIEWAILTDHSGGNACG